MDDAHTETLSGRAVLVVEDEFYLADDLRRALVDRGAAVVGPVATVARARSLVDKERIDFAVLDVNLRGELIFPLAAELRARAVPFVFTTGYDAETIPEEFSDVERWEKPFTADRLVSAISPP